MSVKGSRCEAAFFLFSKDMLSTNKHEFDTNREGSVN